MSARTTSPSRRQLAAAGGAVLIAMAIAAMGATAITLISPGIFLIELNGL